MTAAVAYANSLNIATVAPGWRHQWETCSGSSYAEGLVSETEQDGTDYRWERAQTRCIDITTMFGRDIYVALAEFHEKLEELGVLPRGWDDEDSPSPDPGILFEAESLVRRLLSPWPSGHDPFECYAEIPLPFPSPVPGGGLQLEWRSGRRYLELEFVDSDTILFLQKNEQGWLRPGRMQADNTGKIRSLLDWFVSP